MESENGAASIGSVKLFVGQIPRHMTEEQLLPIFREAGNVHEISIIKDKATRASRGCCFLIYTSKEEADNAITLFHNKRKLPPVSTPLQVKYADGELERLEHKLFIGMLPKTVSEADVAAVFAQFGAIKELTVIKGSQASKGCAFLKFEARDQAAAAINALNDNYKMAGSTTALVVKWADTEKERQARKQQKTQAGSVAISGALPAAQPSLYGSAPSAYGVAAPLNGMGYQAQNPYSLSQYPSQYATQYSTPYSSSALPVPTGITGGVVGAINAAAGAVPAATSYDMTGGTGTILAAGYGTAQHAGYTYPTMSSVQYPGVYQAGILAQGTVPPVYQATAMSNVGLNLPLSTALPVKTVAPPQVEGPAGANLFIYHLPTDFDDHELTTAFQPFGNVVSAKVFVDKVTGLSKCFGFVSYDSPDAAQAAISAMNGTQLGGKRLKVQLKRDSRQNKPY